MAVDATYVFQITTSETLSTVDAASNPVITHDNFNATGRLYASSTPPAIKLLSKVIALSGGAYTINLTTETGTNGVAQDGTGLRVQMIRIKNLGANSMTFAEGASNGIALACLPFTVPAGGIYQLFLNDASPDIAAGDRTIDVSGTTTQTFQLTLLMG